MEMGEVEIFCGGRRWWKVGEEIGRL